MNGINKVLKKMCFYAGVKTADFKKENWFLKHSWNEKQQADFINWLTGELLSNKELRNAIMRFPAKDKKRCKKVAEEFAFNYGWRLK